MSQSPVEIASSLGHDLIGLIENARTEGIAIHGDLIMVPNQIGIAVSKILKTAEVNDATAWVVASAARDHLLEEARTDGSKCESFAKLSTELFCGRLNNEGLELCLDLLRLLGDICGAIGAVGHNGEKLNLMQMAKLAVARGRDHATIVKALHSYGVTPPHSRPEDIDLPQEKYKDTSSLEMERKFQEELRNLATRANVPIQIVCQLVAQMVRESAILKWWGGQLQMDQLRDLSFDPRTLHESVRVAVLGHLENQGLLKRARDGT